MKKINVSEMRQMKLNLGFTLIELTLGLAIFIILLLAVTAMMMNVFRSDSQAKAYEEVQAANLQIVNELIHEARFSVDAWVDDDVSGPDLDRLNVEYIDESTGNTEELDYIVNSDGELERHDTKDGGTIKKMTSKRIKVEKFEIEDVALNNQADVPRTQPPNALPHVPLLKITIELVDTAGETEALDERVFMLSVRR